MTVSKSYQPVNCLKMDVELLDKAKAFYQIDSLCLVVNYFIDPTDERERFLRFAINCKFSDAVGKSLARCLLFEGYFEVFRRPCGKMISPIIHVHVSDTNRSFKW